MRRYATRARQLLFQPCRRHSTPQRWTFWPAPRLIHPIPPFALCSARGLSQPSASSQNDRQVTETYVTDTIYALSTAPGRAGIAVIRISGPSCLEVYRMLCPSKELPRPRFATMRTLFDPTLNGSILDSQALVLYFPHPRTVTGEDIIELHVHGGPATVKAVLSAIPRCSSIARIRYAEPGEFTRRAFFNDKLDLAQVESLSDTLSAETEQQRRAAVRGSSGKLGKTYEAWREHLLQARGEIEALIDFSEDQHFDESTSDLLANVTAQVKTILSGIDQHDMGGQKSELLRNGISIALVGPPNAGKSSLMNLIVGREASIVSGEAGTTRDIVEASLDIRGFLCSFADTAGFRSEGSAEHPLGVVEMEGIRRARKKAEESNIVIVLVSLETVNDQLRVQYDEETLELAARAESSLIVVNKTDKVDTATLKRLLSKFGDDIARQPRLASIPVLPISCRMAALPSVMNDSGNVHHLVSQLSQSFTELTSLPSEQEDLLSVTERQRQLLAECRQHLEEFMLEARPREGGDEADSVIAAEYLRYAADSLARITGRGEAGDVEDVLGVVFEKFCVGK